MNPSIRLALAAAALAVSSVGATAAEESPSVVQGVRLSSLCSDCAVVSSVKRETRKGKGSGVGALGGAVAGGVVGNKTTDSTIGTVGGAAVGGLLGNEIEKRTKRTKVWTTRVTLRDGSRQRFDHEDKPSWQAGSVVELDSAGRLRPRY